MSLRLRLTLWYSLVLALGLVLFGGIVWLGLRHALYGAVESTMRQHADGLAKLLKLEIEEGTSGRQLREELDEYAYSVPEGNSIEVRDAHGQVLLARVALAGKHRIASSQKVTAGGALYSIIADASLEPADAIIAAMNWWMLLFIPVALAVAGAGGYLLSRRALVSVDEITDAARTITLQNLSQRLSVPQTGDELQRLSEAWNETLGRLESAVNRLTQFTADASHELRTPITLIRTAAEVALRKDRSAGEYRDTLQEIREETERTSKLIENLMALARADSGLTALPVCTVDVRALILEASDRARSIAREGLNFGSEVPDEAVTVTGNEAGLRTLFSALVDNALKYTPAGGQVKLSLTRDSGNVLVSVMDTGVGMSPDVVPHIYERFYRADESRNRDAGGFGLGLCIAKWIADGHGAQILVDSEPGRGSIFTVRFPAALS